MLCIICLKEKAPGNEHVIAKALGGSFVTDRVCEDCDNGLGNRADQGLIDHHKIAQRREELGLAGNRGTVPDAQAKVLKKPFIRVDNPAHRMKLEVNEKTGKLEPRTVSVVEFDVVKFPGNGYLIRPRPDRFYIGVQDRGRAEILVKSALRKEGIKDDDLLGKFWDRLAPTLEETEEHAVFHSQVGIRVGGHQFGILKIVYEMAWYWLGDTWLEDPVAVAMRNILNGKLDSLRSRLSDNPNDVLIVGGGDVRLMHACFLLPSKGGYVVGLRLFDVFSALFPVTDSAAKYTPRAMGDAILMNCVERKFEETTVQDLIAGRSGALSRGGRTQESVG